MEKVRGRNKSVSRTRSIAFIALTVALIAVSAWVTVPLGPVPFTLQMFAITFALVVLSPRECIAALSSYLALGALGVPVFSGMRGGIGMLVGPTGGFLWGYLLGVSAAVVLLWVVRSCRFMCGADLSAACSSEASHQHKKQRLLSFMSSTGWYVIAGLLFTLISYLCGWAQFMAVANVGPEAAFFTVIAPFIVVDILKIVAAVICAQAVRTAVFTRGR